MGAFGLDALSSVAYGPDEILYVLLLAGSAGVAFDIPVVLAIALLLAIVVTSYRQTIYAYPNGGGSYTVARENLGTGAGLTAAAALMIDYLTTIAVSVTAGVEAIVAFVPQLNNYRVIADVAAILILILINLRGVREAGAAFVIPTYIFVGSLGLAIAIGVGRLIGGNLPHTGTSLPSTTASVSLFLVLRAFAGGCTAMTGVEAIANGVPVFKPNESRHAARTLVILGAILAVLFIGVAALGRAVGAVPSDQSSVLAQISNAAVGHSPLFYIVQVSASIVLLLAANTSFNGFPRLAAILASDDWMPHYFRHRGMRLAYSNGIIAIGAAAIVMVIAFGGSTHALIPIYAVGVFLCFTLSQTGMVRHWLTTGGTRWHLKLAINGLGALTTGLVTVVVVGSKFTSGAWIVAVLVPIIVVNFVAIHRHYRTVAEGLVPEHKPRVISNHPHVLIPVKAMDKAVVAALEYGTSISDHVTAVHFATAGAEAGEAFAEKWKGWAPHARLRIIESPYREVVGPLLHLVDKIRSEHPGGGVTVLLPEIIPSHVWEEPLHNEMGLVIKLALLYHPGVVVTSVPVRLTEHHDVKHK
jgi:amino acid transporter